MVHAHLRAALLAAVLAGCGEGCAAAEGGSEPAAPSAPTAGTEGAETEAETPPPPEPEPEPVLRVRVAPEGDAVAFRVENRGLDATHLATALLLERSEGDRWTPVPEALGALRDGCEEAPPACRPLAPGGALVPPPWRARRGDGQCRCEGCGALPAGTYRVVVQTCRRTRRVESAPFPID